MNDRLEQALARLRALPSGNPPADELQAVGRRLRKALASDGHGATTLTIGLCSSFLTDMLVDGLVASLARRGILAQIVAAGYGALPGYFFEQEAPFAGCDLLVVLPTHRDLLHRPALGCTRDEAEAAAEREAAFWSSIWARVDCPVVQLGFDPPPARALAEIDGFAPGGLLRHVRAVNQRLWDAAGNRVALVDAEALAASIGPDWHDLRTYSLCKQPFAGSALPAVAEALAASASGLVGKARKVLVLDLDNTLWGGVIGDVGLGGIALGKETSEGEAFWTFQDHVRGLAARGVILAVCSKNRHEIAIEAFRQHSGMVLKEDSIACFAIDFEDKATNLRRIAKTLNVGLDSLVFVDDNPVERGWVKDQLPMVLVVDLPEDPAGYVAALEAARPFPINRLTVEDLGRGDSYRARALQTEMASSATDLDSFLGSLDPVATVEPLSDKTSDRILQLIAKTNQFKMNPTVFSLGELATGGRQVMALSFADRIHDYGIIAVCVFRVDAGRLVILNWVMSCRVFSRRIEHVMLAILAERARAAGVDRIDVDFVASGRNDVAREYLEKIGFRDAGAGALTADVADVAPAGRYMTLRIKEPVE